MLLGHRGAQGLRALGNRGAQPQLVDWHGKATANDYSG